MEKRFLVALALSCLTCSAQLPVIPVALLSPSSIPDPSTIPGLQNWWVSSDLPTDLIVTNWVDRIMGWSLTNGDTTLGVRPTNSLFGVTFGGTQSLTNRMLTVSNKTSFVMVIRTISPHTGTEGYIFSNPGNSIKYGIESGQVELNGNIFFNANTNNMVDWAVTVTDPTTGTRFAYTNNVQASTATIVTPGTVMGGLGGYPGAFDPGKFQVLEFLWYTNNVLTNATWMAAIHKYETNKYPIITP